MQERANDDERAKEEYIKTKRKRKKEGKKNKRNEKGTYILLVQ